MIISGLSCIDTMNDRVNFVCYGFFSLFSYLFILIIMLIIIVNLRNVFDLLNGLLVSWFVCL